MSSESGFAARDAVQIGGYSLEVATPAGSFARFEPEAESENARALAAALEEEPEQRPFAAIEEFEASAQEVTGQIEEAEGLLRTAAEGRLLDPANLTGEVDSLLDLFGRLDKSGRFEEELALMRSLNGLLALSLRWLELVRSLRSLLASAEAVGHNAGQAWAHHELGSLQLCAGNAEQAARHLDKALRIEEQLGDLAGRCATRHNLDAARRQLAGPLARPPRRVVLLTLLAALLVGLGAGGTSLAYAIHGGGGGGGDTSVAFTVEQDFEPDNPRASVTVAVSCTQGGAPDASPKPTSENAPAVFAISGFGADATCTATVRAAPAGYTTDATDCLNVPITDAGSASCTVTSTRKETGSVSFTVAKDFEPGNPAPVSVSVSCTKGGRPDGSPKPAREGAPAVFTISGFGAGATCTASEGAAPAGYTASEDGCRNVAIASGKPAACTITNTRERPASVTFTVTKDFEPDQLETSVSISVSCTEGGTPDARVKTAGEGTPAVFTISGFGPGATCTATEGAAPAGYTGDERDCRNVAIAEKRSCTITNRLNSATFSVGRTFEDGNTSSIAVEFTCNSGTVEPSQGTARDGSPAVFTVTGFTAGATCTATTVKSPSGYTLNERACQGVRLDARECTIVFGIVG
jgi:Domain of unknown function (DUF5979)